MRSKVLVLALLAMLLLAACGPTETTEVTRVVTETNQVEVTRVVEATRVVEVPSEPTTVVETVEVVALPPVDPLAVDGTIVSAGSSTVFPLAERMADLFQDEGFGGSVTIDSIGSGAGFSRFCEAGETDISNASRAIKDTEIESCQAIGREPIEFRVGTDALAVVVSQENDFLEDATFEQLALIFSTAENWSDVDPSWPNEPILRYIPGTDSGTFDYFIEAVFESAPEPILSASNLELSEDDNVLVQGVEGSPYAVGFFGYAYYEQNADKLRALSIEGVVPSAASVDANEYPLARPLFIYSTAQIMQEKPQVAAYINFFLTNVDDYIVDVGYFPASTDALNQAKLAWAAAMGETVSGGGETMAGVALPPVDPLAVDGTIVSAGSSTVFPLAERMADLFQDEGFGGSVTIDSIGSGAGFSRFCEAGETDIANASRAIKDTEIESCQAIGREPIEFRVGTDALAVVVSQENDFLEDATFEQLALIFSTAENWSDVDPSWPNEPILRYIPGTDSGTFDYFIEAVFESAPEPILSASNLELSEDDNVLVQGVEGSPYAVGFFGYAYYEQNADKLRALSIEGVVPSAASVDANEYPLARPLFIYSTAQIMQEKPQVAAYINFFLTYVNDYIIEVGYFPASDDALNQAKLNWLNAMN